MITLLGVDQHETLDEPRRFQRPVAIVLGVLLFVLIVVIAQSDWVTGRTARRRPARRLARRATCATSRETLFTDYIWAFEITAVLLVIAVVGGVVLARRSGQRPAEPTAGDEAVIRRLAELSHSDLLPHPRGAAVHDRRGRAAASAATRS